MAVLGSRGRACLTGIYAGSVTGSSSHPGRSAWRAGSLPPEANGYKPPPQDATPRSAPISYKGLKTDIFSEGTAMPSTLASTLAIKERGALAPVCPAVRTEPEFIDFAVVWLDVIAAILGLSRLEARVRSRPPTSRFRTIQVCPKDLADASGPSCRLPALATELVRRQVAVIVATGGSIPALSAKAATTTVSLRRSRKPSQVWSCRQPCQAMRQASIFSVASWWQSGWKFFVRWFPQPLA